MGLNLNYTPNRLVDITTLTEDQWLSWRRKGIGGSDVAKKNYNVFIINFR